MLFQYFNLGPENISKNDSDVVQNDLSLNEPSEINEGPSSPLEEQPTKSRSNSPPSQTSEINGSPKHSVSQSKDAGECSRNGSVESRHSKSPSRSPHEERAASVESNGSGNPWGL